MPVAAELEQRVYDNERMMIIQGGTTVLLLSSGALCIEAH